MEEAGLCVCLCVPRVLCRELTPAPSVGLSGRGVRPQSGLRPPKGSGPAARAERIRQPVGHSPPLVGQGKIGAAKHLMHVMLERAHPHRGLGQAIEAAGWNANHGDADRWPQRGRDRLDVARKVIILGRRRIDTLDGVGQQARYRNRAALPIEPVRPWDESFGNGGAVPQRWHFGPQSGPCKSSLVSASPSGFAMRSAH